MQVELRDISKNFQSHAVFKGVNLTLPDGYRGVVLGGNGSGKSTLLKIISGALTPSSGKVVYREKDGEIAENYRYKKVAFCGPYTDLIEDFTLNELIDFQQLFRPFLPGIDKTGIVELVYLKTFQDKAIKTYSSGMKQRVRLALAVLADVPLLLLDEPTSNLDPQGKSWYTSLIKEFLGNRSVLVASNHLPQEYDFTNAEIDLHEYR